MVKKSFIKPHPDPLRGEGGVKNENYSERSGNFGGAKAPVTSEGQRPDNFEWNDNFSKKKYEKDLFTARNDGSRA